MESNHKKEKLHLVWGSVYLAALAAWGMTIMFSVEAGSEVLPIVIAMMISVLLSAVTVPLLLSVPGSSAALLGGGRVLLWLQALCLGVALVMGVVQMS